MIVRTLSASTIVPQQLYVERAADRQLRSIIAEMGRPGYILVARQMGKTNLLLNMKREQSDSLVLYLDLSNRFASARSWFRNVIDRLMELSEDLEVAKGVIDAQRAGDRVEPNVEFDRHLRRLLKMTAQKIIIILDEIDSLVTTEYSDVILAQVRSMYFSRISYEEYERLTYVLSGVAEPSDLIKDKNISPFNIGEKIYLYNFDRSEFAEFVKKARLALSSTVADRIFEWTRGNPRMTWDICSELELVAFNSPGLTQEQVDEAVKKLYLRDYDRAPVDHIRILATSDSHIRNALVEIRYGKYEFLDAKMKSRLYLAGITNSAAETNAELANKIVDLALSEDWIAAVNLANAGPSSLAIDSYESANYSAAVEQYEKILSALPNSDDFSLTDRVSLGMSYLYTGNTVSALRELEHALARISDEVEAQKVQLFIGVAQVTLNNVAQGLQSLWKASNGPVLSVVQHAVLESIPAMLKLGVNKNGSAALKISSDLIDELNMTVNSGNADVKERLVSALYCRAKVYQALRNVRSANVDIEAALPLSSRDMLPTLTLCKYQLCVDGSEKKRLAVQLCDQIVLPRVRIQAGHDLSLNFNKRYLLQALLVLSSHGMIEEFSRVAGYCAESVFKNRLSSFSSIVSLYDELNDEESQVKFSSVLAFATRNLIGGARDIFERVRVLMLVTYRSQGTNLAEFGDLYLHDLEICEDFPSDFFTDFHAAAFLRLSDLLSRTRNVALSSRLYTQWNRFRASAVIDSFWMVYLDYQEMVFRKDFDDLSSARLIAALVVEGTEPEKESQFQEVEWNAVLSFRKQALKLIYDKPHGIVPLREQESDPFRSYSRNDRVVVQYPNLSPVEKKFKVVEADLRSGVCTLVR